MKTLLLIFAASVALAQSGPPFIISAPLFDASSSGATKPIAVVLNTGALQVSGCTQGQYAFVKSNGLTYTNNATGSCTWTPLATGAGGTSGQIQFNNGGLLGGFTASGDFTINTSTGVATVSKLLNGALAGIVKANGASPVTAAASSDIGALFTGCSSGSPFLSYTGACISSAGSGWAYLDTSGATSCGLSMCKTITAATHHQGPLPFAFCTSLAPTSGHMADGSNYVPCAMQQTGSTAGDIIVSWTSGDVLGIVVAGPGSGGGGSGTVTSIDVTFPALFNVSGGPVTTSGTIAATLANQTANRGFFGPTSGSPAAPTFRALVAADITPAGTLSNNISGTAALATAAAALGTPCSPGNYARGVDVSFNATGCTSVGAGTVITSGTMTNTAIVTSDGGVTIMNPNASLTASSGGDIGGPGAATFSKGFVIPQGSYPGPAAANVFQWFPNTSIPTSYGWQPPSADAAGLIGSDGAGTPGHLTSAPLSGDGTTSAHVFTLATVNSGPGVCGDSTHVCQVTTNGKGLVTAQTQVAISAGGSGTVMSVGMSLPAFLTVSGSPVTTTGTLTAVLANQSANAVFVGPTSGGSAAPTFRSLVNADVAAAGTLSNSTTGTAAGLNGVNTASLGTGILKSTTGTGVPSIAVAADVGALGTLSNSTTGNALTATFATTAGGAPPTGSAGGYLGGSFPSPLLYSDIRNFGATCNGSNSHSSIVSALQAGLKELYIPSGCNWTIPSTDWTYTVGPTTYTVMANAIPANLYIPGQNWNTSVIQTTIPASQPILVGPNTTLSNVTLKSGSCTVQDVINGGYTTGASCPTGWTQNGDIQYSGTVNTVGTAVTLATGSLFNVKSSGNYSWSSPNNFQFFIGGTAYTVASVTDSSHLTLTGSAGTQTGVPYLANQYDYPLSNGSGFLNMMTKGPQDSNGLHFDGHGGDVIFIAQHNGEGDAIRLNSDTDNGTQLLHLQNISTQTVDLKIEDCLGGTCNGVTSGAPISFQTSHLTSGTIFQFQTDSVSYGGNVIDMNMGAGGGGAAFTGNFLNLSNAGNLKAQIDSNGALTLRPTTVSGLGTCNSGVEGKHWGVTDALAPSFLVTIVGGGSTHSPVYCNGSNWVSY